MKSKLMLKAMLVLVAVVLLTVPASAQRKSKKSTKPVVADKTFAMKAAMGGMEEVELGKIAAERGSSDAVKQFGQRMVDDHSKANEDLMSVASGKGLTLPTELDAKHRADVARFSKLSGAAFDRAFAQEAVKDHTMDVKEFQHESNSGKDADFKSFASRTLPVIQEHLRMAREMNSSMMGRMKK